ncbi:MAG: hypothetical protein GXO25_00580, partial [Euryarchaeota archaeon]|nr:hypothetical protein [Euryarchaeota archaeon]
LNMFLEWLAPYLKVLGRAWHSFMQGLNVLKNWVIGMLKEAFNKFVGMLNSIASGYTGEIIDAICGIISVSAMSLIVDAEIFGYAVIGEEIGGGIILDVFSGGFSSAESIMAKVISGEFINEFLEYAGKARFLNAFLIGMMLRVIEEILLESTNMSASEKASVKTIFDVIATTAGIVSGLLGDRDLRDLIMGYIVFIIGITAEYWIKKVGITYGWSNEEIKVLTATVQAAVLLILLYLSVKSIVTLTISDDIGGPLGYFDEFILGFLFASALLTFSGSIAGLLQELINGIESQKVKVTG